MCAQKVCVLGAGLSGLVAIKSCLEEGLEPVCLEREQDIGGTWRYTENIQLPRACVHHSLIMNTSRFTSVFSDFPAGADEPFIWDHKQYLQYLRKYADRFELVKHVNFGVTVRAVVPVEDNTGVGGVKWEVCYATEGGGVKKEVFDGVMYCGGLFHHPHYPDIPGLQEFAGEVIHTHNFRIPDSYRDKKVFVIGLGSSGGEVAADIARVADQVYVTRGDDGMWILRRAFLFGLPPDVIAYSGPMGSRPASTAQKWIMGWLFNLGLDHDAWGLTPQNYMCGDKFPLASENFAMGLLTGKILLRPDVTCFKDGHVIYSDGSRDNIDVVVLGTGYEAEFSCLPDDVVPVSNNELSCYKYTFLTDAKYRSLGFMGCFRALGGVAPIIEMQCRWYTRVLKGLAQLPPKEAMENNVMKSHVSTHRNEKHGGMLAKPNPWKPLLESLASEIGVSPSPWQYLFSDPSLALRLLFGPCNPTRYRLIGPGAWAGARKAIMDLRLYKEVTKNGTTFQPAYIKFLKFVCVSFVICTVMFVCLLLWLLKTIGFL